MNKGSEQSSKKCLKRFRHSVVMALMAAIVLLIMTPITVKAEEGTTGTLGNNNGITWTYDAETQTLTLTGKDSGLYSNYGGYIKYSVTGPEYKHIVLENCIISGSVYNLFNGLSGVESIKFKNVDFSGVTDMSYMFDGCAGLKTVELGELDTSNVKKMSAIFRGCKSLEAVDLSGLNLSSVEGTHYMFYNCTNLKTVDFSGVDLSKASSMYSMFSNCENLESVNLSGTDASNLNSMEYMFQYCKSLISLNLKDFTTSKVSNMREMFSGCASLTNLDLSDIHSSSITDMACMFAGCTSLERLNLSSLGMSSSSRYIYMWDVFKDCSNLKEIATLKSIKSDITIDLPHTFYTTNGTATTILNRAFQNMILTSVSNINPFADVKESSWQYKATKYVYDNGLMTGKGTDANGNIIFDPDKPIPREEFVQVLYNASGKPAVNVENIFPDVKNAWYKNAVLWAYENNIAKGKGNGDFGVTESISRQDLALMLYKYANLKGYDLSANAGEINKYADGNKVSSYAKTAMDWAITKGIMSGKGTKGEPISTFKLDPTGTATRAECAAMLMNFMEAY